LKQLLNTLYVTTDGSYIRKDGTNLVISTKEKDLGRIPVFNIQSLVCFGNIGVSPYAMRLCSENSVSVSFMSDRGRFIASVQGEIRGNVLLRREQYRIADDPVRSLDIAKHMVRGKLVNCRRVLSKGFSNHPDRVESAKMNSCIQTLKKATEDVISAESADELRGIEGCAATAYFECLDQLILKDKDHFFIRGRNRRPPRDRFNALISFLYALLANDIASALESVGMDPYVGFMHTDRPGRASLALDMMEELRPAADRVALRLINLGLLDKDGFIEKEGGAVMLDDDGRRSVLDEWQEYKKGNVRHPFLNENIPMGIVPFVQASLLARSIRGEIDGYPPFILVQ